MPEKKHHLFKSAEEKAEDEAEARAQWSAHEEERHRQEFAATTQGQARAAYERGLDWFEIEMDLRGPQHSATARSNAAQTQGLTDVEYEGWALVDVNHVFVPHRASGGGGEAGSERYRIEGEIVGIYMFRRDASKRRAAGGEG
ncbi:MAG TPA: hypothetical protein VGL93_03400 [Streptosporangiaceae bacterium]|jgi:hypothetical protein